MRVVLCDDNRILCDALSSLLEARGHQAVAVVTRASEAVAVVGTHLPDACLLDLNFPDGSGLDAARVLRHRYPGVKILLFSCLLDASVLSVAKRIGVAGFVRKDQNVEMIINTLDMIGDGETVFRPQTAGRRVPRAVSSRRTSPPSLSEREAQVLRLIAAGYTTEKMAREMGVTTNTLRSYIKNVLTKLGVHSRIQAAEVASRWPAPVGGYGCAGVGGTLRPVRVMGSR